MRSSSPLLAFLGVLATTRTFAQTCSNGVVGVEAFNQCCVLECGICGGSGCRERAELVGLSADDCCVTRIRNSEVYCETTPVAPCRLASDPNATPAPSPTSICPDGTQVCNDPHLQGLRGQHFVWTGVDGEWYALVQDEEIGLQVNVRPTAPLRDTFPERQYVTGVSVVSGGHSIVIQVDEPYSAETPGCPDGVSPCLADGGLSIKVDGEEAKHLYGPVLDEPVVGFEVSSSNLPTECREFGGSRIWARMLNEMRRDRRYLKSVTFPDWILSFNHVVAPEWCAKFIQDQGLAHVQSNQSVFRIKTPTATVRFSAGINHRRGGKVDRHGRELPELDFWQTSVGVEGLDVEHEHLTGLLGETARPTYDVNGIEITEGLEVLPCTVEDFRVSSAAAADFSFSHSSE